MYTRHSAPDPYQRAELREPDSTAAYYSTAESYRIIAKLNPCMYNCLAGVLVWLEPISERFYMYLAPAEWNTRSEIVDLAF